MWASRCSGNYLDRSSMSNQIEYLKGDATDPTTSGNKIIVHVCNDIGGWGKGFVMAISKRWTEPEKQYRQWYKSGDNFELGQVQFVQVETDLWIANLIGQHKLNRDKHGNPPIRYEAIKEGLDKVGQFAVEKSKHTYAQDRMWFGWRNLGSNRTFDPRHIIKQKYSRSRLRFLENLMRRQSENLNWRVKYFWKNVIRIDNFQNYDI